jgi:hypothetical protein
VLVIAIDMQVLARCGFGAIVRVLSDRARL